MVKTRILVLLPVLLFLGVAGAFLWGLSPDRNPRIIPSPLIDQPAPQFTLPSLRADLPDITSRSIEGQPVLVNVFASWCQPCLIEHPLLMRLAREEGLTIVGINYKDQPADAEAWLTRHGDPYGPIARDADGRAAIDWGVYGVPESFLLDGQGRIRFKQTGPLTPQVIDRDLLPLLKSLRG
jgi:cytochrome c biogenesis protein CcmG, thiol:disulfide interchange protein DsbE